MPNGALDYPWNAWLPSQYQHIYMVYTIPDYMVPFRVYCRSQRISRQAGLKWIRKGKIEAKRYGTWWFVDRRQPTPYRPPSAYPSNTRRLEPKPIVWPPFKDKYPVNRDDYAAMPSRARRKTKRW